MAIATVRTVTKVEGITLELTELEAKVLISVLRRVGGCPTKSYRKNSQDILRALQGALPDFNEYRASRVDDSEYRVAEGNIQFNNLQYQE